MGGMALHSLHASHDVAASPCDKSISSDSSVASHGSAHSSKHGAHRQASDSEDSDIDLTKQPRLPYVVGFSTIATKHKPPEPFGVGYSTEDAPEVIGWQTLSQLEYCLARLPLGGNTISHETKTLTVTSVIRTGYGRGAQLVVVNEDTVAKIYDPLYYEYTNDFDIKQDIVYDADGDYSREASAYIELQKSTAASKVVPAYHGTWTIDIDVIVRKGETPQKCTRRVPLILMEYLRGQPMVNIEVDSLSQRIQSQVLREVLDAEAVIYHAGIDHRDFLPRNIMITGVDKGDEPSCLVVKVFDFNCSTVLGHPRYRDRQYIHQTNKLLAKWHPKLLNPIVRWYGQMNELSVPGWCSARYAEQWLWEQYHDDERYIPVVWDPSNPDTRPQYAEFESGSEKSVDSGLDLDSAVEKGEECGDMSGLGSADHIALAIQSS